LIFLPNDLTDLNHSIVKFLFRRLFLLLGALLCHALNSCAPKAPPEGSHAHFALREDYPKTSDYWKDKELYGQMTPDAARIKIDTSLQRGFLLHGEQVVIDYPICSGRKTHPTPKGVYKVLEKKVEKSSNRYGRIYDAEGKLVNGDADIRIDEVPEGGKFVGAPMPYWMRLTNDGIGHHVGPVKRYPASHGCIRGPQKVIPYIFKRVQMGSEIMVD
jgi:hypothetical protein